MPLVEQELLTLPEHLSSPADFGGVRVTRSLALCVCFVDRCLSFCALSFGHCTVCSSSIYGFWLPPFSIFKLFNLKFSMYGFVNHCLSFSSFSFVVSFVLLITDTDCYFDIIKLSSIPVRQWSSSYEKFEDTKGVIKSRKSKDRQNNGQKKQDKWTNNDLRNNI